MFFVGVNHFLQHGACLAQLRFTGALGDAQLCGNLQMAVAFDGKKIENGAVPERQGTDHIVQILRLDCAIGAGPGRDGLCSIVADKFELVLAQEHQSFVDHDAGDPFLQTVFPAVFECVDGQKDLVKSLAKDVFGLLLLPHVAVAQAEHLRLKVLVQGLLGLSVTFSAALDQFIVFQNLFVFSLGYICLNARRSAEVA